jgi:hypothetical protein
MEEPQDEDHGSVLKHVSANRCMHSQPSPVDPTFECPLHFVLLLCRRLLTIVMLCLTHLCVRLQMLEPERQNTAFQAFDEYASSKDIDETIEAMETLCKQVQNFPVADLVMDDLRSEAL